MGGGGGGDGYSNPPPSAHILSISGSVTNNEKTTVDWPPDSSMVRTLEQQCCGSGMFILDPGSGFFPSRIPDSGVKKAPDPGSRVKKIPDPGPQPASKNLSILTQKL